MHNQFSSLLLLLFALHCTYKQQYQVLAHSVGLFISLPVDFRIVIAELRTSLARTTTFLPSTTRELPSLSLRHASDPILHSQIIVC
jgi:hypothetical protein